METASINELRYRNFYNQSLAKRFRNVDMLGIMGRDLQETPTSLAEIYVPLRLGEQHREVPDEENPGEELIPALLKHRHLAISGPPGSGKSTLVAHLASGLAAAGPTPVNQQLPELIALPFILRSLDFEKIRDLDSFLDVWAQRFGEELELGPLPMPWLHAYLRRGQCLLLFDGVDELGKASQLILRDEVVMPLRSKYPDNFFVVTGRPTGFSECAYAEKEVEEVKTSVLSKVKSLFQTKTYSMKMRHVQPFRDADIEIFTDAWFKLRARTAVEARERRDVFLRVLRANQSLGEMKHRPVYLTMLAIVQETKGTLPDSRAEAYRQIVDCYIGTLDTVRQLKERQQEEVVPPWPDGEKLQILEHLAYQLHEQAVRNQQRSDLKISVSREELKEKFTQIVTRLSRLPGFSLAKLFEEDSQKLIEKLLRYFEARTGLLVETATGRFQFSHLSFQEYLTASHLFRSQDQDEEEGEQAQTPLDYLQKYLIQPMSYDSWHEVGILFFAIDAREKMRKQDRLLNDLLGWKNGAFATDKLEQRDYEGRLKFWIKLLGNSDNRISPEYRAQALDKLMAWADSPLLGDYAGIGNLIAEHWRTPLGDLQVLFDKQVVNPAFFVPSCSTEAFRKPTSPITEPQARLARLLLLVSQHKDYCRGLDPKPLKEITSEKQAFLGYQLLTIALDLCMQDHSDPFYEKNFGLDHWFFDPIRHCGTHKWPKDTRALSYYQNLDALVKARVFFSKFELNWFERFSFPRDRAFQEGILNSNTNSNIKVPVDRDRDWARDLDRVLALARDRDRVLDRVRILDRVRDLALALDLTLALDRALDLDRAQARVRDRALDLDLARAQARALDLDLARAQARVRDLARDLDLDRVRVRDLVRDLTLAQILQSKKTDKLFDTYFKTLPSFIQALINWLLLRDLEQDLTHDRVVKAQNRLQHFHDHFKKELAETDASYLFFEAAHLRMFAKDAPLHDLLFYPFQPHDFPITLEQIDQKFHGQLKILITSIEHLIKS